MRRRIFKRNAGQQQVEVPDCGVEGPLVERANISPLIIGGRVVHLDVEERSEDLLRQLSYAIKNQLVASKAPSWFFMA